MTINRRQILKAAASSAILPSLMRPALAADWPKERVIRAVVPFNAGASTDIMGRIVSDFTSRQIGQTIVIENRGGAGGSLGASQVARADADGYTLLINASAHTIAPAIYKNIQYDAVKDFAGVAMIGTVPNVLLVSKDSGFTSAKDLVEKGKKGTLTFSSSGIGSASHWAAERFRIAADFKATHVPMRGGADSLTEVIAGRIDFCCVGISAALPFIGGDGKAKPLCVTSLKRSPRMPDVATSTELGYVGSDFAFWSGYLVPAKTPRPIVNQLHKAVMAAIAMPEVRKKLEVQGVEDLPVTPEQFDELMRKEVVENVKIARAAGIQTQ